MKANEAPEKIYLIRNFSSSTSLNTTNDNHGKFLNEWYKSREKDAFIEKACEWLNKNADKYIWYSDYAEFPGNDTCGMNADFIEDFKNYMKGE